MEHALKDAEGKLEANIDIAALRRDQVKVYALLGDPATKLRLPHPLQSAINKEGGTYRWRAEKPSGGGRLYVDFRQKNPSFAKSEKLTDADTAWQRHEEALASLTFDNQDMLDYETSWEGTIDKPGTLRLTVIGEKACYVAVHELR